MHIFNIKRSCEHMSDIPLGIVTIEWGYSYTSETLNFIQLGFGFDCSFGWIHDSIVRGLEKNTHFDISSFDSIEEALFLIEWGFWAPLLL